MKQQYETRIIIWIIKLAANVMLRWLCRVAKQRFLFFVQQKISKRYPWQTQFFAYVISQKQTQINKTNYATMLFTSKQVSLPKLTRSCKLKIGPKCFIHPFCTEAFNWHYYSTFIHCTNSSFLIGWIVSCDTGLWRDNHLDIIIVVRNSTHHCHYTMASTDSNIVQCSVSLCSVFNLIDKNVTALIAWESWVYDVITELICIF